MDTLETRYRRALEEIIAMRDVKKMGLAHIGLKALAVARRALDMGVEGREPASNAPVGRPPT